MLSRKSGASEGGNGFMENDRVGAPGSARRAWAGDSEDKGSDGAAEQASQGNGQVGQQTGW